MVYEELYKYNKDYYEKHKNDPKFIETIMKYQVKHKERIKLYQQQWKKENIEKLQAYFKQRHQEQKFNPIYIEKRKEEKKKWNQSEKGKQSNREYNNRPGVKKHRSELNKIKKETETYEQKQHRKQVAKDWASQKITCCGKEMNQKSLAEHKKTSKHQKFSIQCI